MKNEDLLNSLLIDNPLLDLEGLAAGVTG